MPDQKLLILANGNRNESQMIKDIWVRLPGDGNGDTAFGQSGFLDVAFGSAANPIVAFPA